MTRLDETDTAAAIEGAWPLPLPGQPVQFAGPEPDGWPETITWRDAAQPPRPAVDETVLLRTTDDDMPIAQGWWDASGRWCLCESGGYAPEGSVLAWADVKGPAL